MARKTIKENGKSSYKIAGQYKSLKEVNTKTLYKYYTNNKGSLSYTAFKEVISKFNQQVSVQILLGYHFKMPHRVGIIKIIENVRKIRISKNGNINTAVNWGESLKIRKEILSRNGLPYKAIKDEKGNIIGDNNGEKWLCYHTEPVFYSWIRLEDTLLHNGTWYTFQPTWHNARGLIAGLDEDSALIYDRGKRDFKNKVEFKIRLFGEVKVANTNFDLCNQ